MTKLEKEIEQKLRVAVAKHGGQCLKWVCPGWSGVPDRIVLLPGGRIYFVELKRPKGGTYSPMQKWWADKLRDLGFWVLSIHNETDIGAFELMLIQDEKR